MCAFVRKGGKEAGAQGHLSVDLAQPALEERERDVLSLRRRLHDPRQAQVIPSPVKFKVSVRRVGA